MAHEDVPLDPPGWNASVLCLKTEMLAIPHSPFPSAPAIHYKPSAICQLILQREIPQLPPMPLSSFPLASLSISRMPSCSLSPSKSLTSAIRMCLSSASNGLPKCHLSASSSPLSAPPLPSKARPSSYQYQGYTHPHSIQGHIRQLSIATWDKLLMHFVQQGEEQGYGERENETSVFYWQVDVPL